MTLKKMQTKYFKLLEKSDKIKKEIADSLDDMLDLKVRPNKKCVKWYKEHGEECGVPYDELTAIYERRVGTVMRARFDGEDGFTFTVGFGCGMSILLGLEHLTLVKDKK